jgi:hypothetical protein
MSPAEIRYSPEGGQSTARTACPLLGDKRTHALQQKKSYSITSLRGRAGNGEELGGLNGLRVYHQRFALQGSTDLIAAAKAVPFA